MAWRGQHYSRLQNVSTTGVDSRGQEGTPGDSIDGGKRRGIKVLERKSCAISLLVDRHGSGSTPAALSEDKGKTWRVLGVDEFTKK